ESTPPNAAFFKTDRHGFRNPDEILPSRGKAMLLGDSFVQGYWLGDNETISARLRAMYGDYVYNFGVGGYSTDQEFLIAREALIHFRTDFVVVFFYINDLPYLRRNDGPGGGKPQFFPDRYGRLDLGHPILPEYNGGPETIFDEPNHRSTPRHEVEDADTG